jgi:hypothetical protein
MINPVNTTLKPGILPPADSVYISQHFPSWRQRIMGKNPGARVCNLHFHPSATVHLSVKQCIAYPAEKEVNVQTAFKISYCTL